jgi:hypothetical protein
VNLLQKKLRIKADMEIIALNAPASYEKTLGKLPRGTTISRKLKQNAAFIHLFVKDKTALEQTFLPVAKATRVGGLLWISYPKISSGIQTDLTRDHGWEILKKVNFRWLSLISFDENYSAFLMKNEAPPAQSRDSAEYHANKEQWSDAKTKTVKIPDDLEKQFTKYKKARDLFNALNFTGRKEYVMWIVSAKREETRTERLKKAIEKILAGKKTPAEK